MHHRSQWPLKAGTLLTAIAGICSTPLPALAQQNALEEIVITAQRRETNLQETPMSVQAFSMEELTDAGIQTSSELDIKV